ncbi:thiopurine S-methyltransferase [Pseudomaricurvus sp. HS19]|uniref:thiopurine S-methyltransferase n=1 Tax=Pseudomaricurvus sp. HS19 TaxID=2692626 RepID=UPI00136DF5E8|nr:thiopurine S-methyltransferase [Pseudomaricurvus sp. HS19]MYM63998.1 thiopurine S-methyltransferase [Pseudomaricurvus sp. HS19]
MEADFWMQKWDKGELGFHQSVVNPFLAAHLQELNLVAGSRVFVPLCGKSLDMVWLRDQGFQVVGIELVPSAVAQFFDALDVTPEITVCGELQRFSGAGIEVFVGDFFALTPALLGTVDLVYDRAALVALPAEIRRRYAEKMMQLCRAVPQLLVTFDYEQSLLAGPPFSVPEAEVQRLYGAQYGLICLDSVAVSGGPRGDVGAREIAWQLVWQND